MPEIMSGDMPDRMSVGMTERMSSKDMPESATEDLPERMSKRMAGDARKNVRRYAEGMSQMKSTWTSLFFYDACFASSTKKSQV